jgi:hypothetical protein
LRASFRITWAPESSFSASRSGAGGHHVHRPVVVASHEHAERRGRLRELLDLLGERLDALLLVAQGIRELLVLSRRPRERLSGLDELLFEELDLPGGVRQAAPEEADLLLQEGDLCLQLVDLLLALLGLLVAVRHPVSPPPWTPMLPPASARLQRSFP